MSRTLAAIPCFSLIALACPERNGLPERSSRVSVSQFVGREAAESLTADGLFIVPGAIELGEQQIDAKRAVDLARAFVQAHAYGVLDILEKDRGGRIDHTLLKPCGRAYYSEPAILPLPPEDHPVARRAYGPHWVVLLCGDSDSPEVSLAVSSLATDVALVDGVPSYPRPQGEFFRWLGVPYESEGIPETPETAVSEVARTTGRRIVTVPRLIRFPRWYPQRGLWMMQLDTQAQFTLRSGHVRESRVVLYGKDSRTLKTHIWIPADSQPESAEYIKLSRDGFPPKQTWGVIGRRAGVPLLVEAAAPR